MASGTESPLYFHVSDSPCDNYFYADDLVACQAILASPLPHTSLDGSLQHRLLLAWSAGNSGALVYFSSPNSDGNSLHMKLRKSPQGRELMSISLKAQGTTQTPHSSVGVEGITEFSSSATLDLAILGSLRTIRDYAEGHAILNPKVQDGICIEDIDDGVKISRQ